MNELEDIYQKIEEVEDLNNNANDLKMQLKDIDKNITQLKNTINMYKSALEEVITNRFPNIVYSGQAKEKKLVDVYLGYIKTEYGEEV